MISVIYLVRADHVAPKVKFNIGISQYEDKAEYQRRYRALNPDKVKKYQAQRDREKTREAAWLRRYGITRDDYNKMLSEQNGCCAICASTEVGRNHTHFHVDHCHTTGQVRGLLCDLCNRGLGYFKDRYDMLEKASGYLKKFQSDE